MVQKKVRYGIISTASIAPRFVGAVKCTDNGEVVAVSSRSLEKAQAFAQEYQIPKACGDYKELLQDPDVDAVYLPLVNSLHYPFALEALEAGKHVILEKPFVLYPWQGEELKKLAYDRGLFITEAVKTPFLPVIKAVKEITDSGRYGQIRFMEFKQSYVGGNYTAGWNVMKEYGGGCLYGNEAYFLSIAELFGGKIKSISGSATYGGEVEDQCSVDLVLENDILANGMVSSRVLLRNGLDIHMDKARIWIPDYWKGKEASIYQGDELIEKLSYPCKYELMYELQHYSECILQGSNESPVVRLDDSIRHIELCRRLYDEWDEMQNT